MGGGRADDEYGGDPACWMHLVCESCGALPDEDPPPALCPRCGVSRTTDET